MVKQGVAFIKANGRDKGYAEITNKAGKFVDRDLYLVVYGLDGTVRAHGANGKMVGKNLIDLKDVDGKPFVKERVELAKLFIHARKERRNVLLLGHIDLEQGCTTSQRFNAGHGSVRSFFVPAIYDRNGESTTS